jgi:hypothetical protein
MYGADNTVTGSIYLYMSQLFVSHLIDGIEQEGEKIEFCCNMTVLCRTSVKIYVVLCACDFLFGEKEDPHKVHTSQQGTLSWGVGES